MTTKGTSYKIAVCHRLTDGTLAEQKNMFWNDSLSFIDVIDVLPYLINNDNFNYMVISVSDNNNTCPPDAPQ